VLPHLPLMPPLALPIILPLAPPRVQQVTLPQQPMLLPTPPMPPITLPPPPKPQTSPGNVNGNTGIFRNIFVP
jgi:hypothetical protein